MSGKIVKEKLAKELANECKSIKRALNRLKLLAPSEAGSKMKKICRKFKEMSSSWLAFSCLTQETIETDKKKASKYLRSMQISRKMLMEVKKDKKRIKSQEIILRKQELRLGRSLDKIKGMWQSSLSDMESSLKMQKDALNRISQDYFSGMKGIDHEINDVLRSPAEPLVPSLNFNPLSSKKVNTKKLSGQKTSNHKASDEEFISNRSAFSILTEDVPSARSLSTNQKRQSRKNFKTAQVSEPSKFSKPEKIKNEPPREGICQETSEFSATLAEKSKPDNVSLLEIKEALLVLKKANLINNSGNSQLLKIAEMIKDPENTSNLELMLQLIEIENRKNKAPSDKKKSRIRIKPRIKKSKITEFDDTSREKFRFSEEKSFNRTLLSNEFLLSPKNFDEGLESFCGKEELTDVKLEDLLGVASLMEDLGLVSADNSLINANDHGTSGFIFEDDRRDGLNSYDEVPVKISKKSKCFVM